MPFGDDKQALSNALWLETDRRYHEAVSRARLRPPGPADAAQKRVRTIPTSRTSRPRRLHRGAREARVRQGAVGRAAQALLGEGAARAQATRGTCGVVFQLNTAYFVNSEGSQIQQSWTNAQLSVSVGVKADDGMNLSRLEQRFGRTPADLPADAEVDKMIAHGHRRSRRAPRRAARRAVRRPGDPRGPRRRRVLPRGVRSPHRGPPPEGPDERPDVRELRRQGHRAGLAERLRRPRDRHAQRHPAQRLLSLRRRRRARAPACR